MIGSSEQIRCYCSRAAATWAPAPGFDKLQGDALYETEQPTLESLDLKSPTRTRASADATHEDPAARELEPVSFEVPTLVGGSDVQRLRLHRQFVSAFLPARRDVIIALPPDYFTASMRRYPTVLYLQDGQNLFDGATSFIKGCIWDVQTTADRLIDKGAIEPLIVVGVYNTGIERMEEYTPMRDRNLGGGKANLYGRSAGGGTGSPGSIATYRTLDGPAHDRASEDRRWAGWCRFISG